MKNYTTIDIVYFNEKNEIIEKGSFTIEGNPSDVLGAQDTKEKKNLREK